MAFKKLYPLLLFIFSLTVMGKLLGAAQGQFPHEKVMSTPFIFLLVALGGSSEADRG